jgi:tetratricopeptide (TPR) repeat protein
MQHDALRNETSGMPVRVEQSAVPYYPQQNYQCGPAALAMVFANAGVARSPDELSGDVFIPGREGSLQIEMLAAPRRYGLVSVMLKPQLKDLLTEVAAGQPAVVLQNLGFDWYPTWHYAVVIGYDLDRNIVILRSGSMQREEVAMSKFDRTWRRSGYWAMLVLPPDRLPQTVAASDYTNAVVKLESAGQKDAARRAYNAALQRWPDDLTALIGSGNTAYADRDLPAAIAAFQSATSSHPESAIAFNNLAQALADSHRYDDALKAARKAVELDGPTVDAAERTLQSVSEEIAKTTESPNSRN